MNNKLSDDEFDALLNVLIEADPWSFTANRQPIEDLLDSEARGRGYCDWIEALHKFRLPGCGRQVSKPGVVGNQLGWNHRQPEPSYSQDAVPVEDLRSLIEKIAATGVGPEACAVGLLFGLEKLIDQARGARNERGHCDV